MVGTEKGTSKCTCHLPISVLTLNQVAERKQTGRQNLCPGGVYVLKRWFSKRGPWICSISIIQELVSNPNFQALAPRPLDSETVLTKLSGDSDADSGLRTNEQDEEERQ